MEARPLITPDEVRRIAREEKLTAGVVEKDYALTWLLRGINGKNSRLRAVLVLKGGTAIRKVYFPQAWRFSEDLDFTTAIAQDADSIRESLQAVFEALLSESGISYSLESFHTTPGSIIADVQFLGPLNFRNRIRHDIALRERMVLKPERKAIQSSYPDLSRFNVLVYPLAELLAEKIRSIMQRAYSRDYYDVWKLLKEERFRDSEVKRLLVRKCKISNIRYEPASLFDEKRLTETRSFWASGLGHLTRQLPDFDAVIAELKDRLAFLQE